MKEEKVKIKDKYYEIQKFYPESGQKKVLKVFSKEENKNYIFKILKFNDMSDLNRIYLEGETLSKIISNNFAKIYMQDIDLENKEYKILEEYIEGETLREKIQKYKGNEEECIKLFKKIILAMKNLWKKDIIHRDLKPENIIIKNDGEPVILDLGIVKVLTANKNVTLLNEKMPFTNYYCAPEQYKNEENSLSIRTDFFILGIVLGEMYTGKHIFENAEGERNILGDFNKTGNQKLDILLNKLLAKEPFNRFRTEDKILDYLNKEWGV